MKKVIKAMNLDNKPCPMVLYSLLLPLELCLCLLAHPRDRRISSTVALLSLEAEIEPFIQFFF